MAAVPVAIKFRLVIEELSEDLASAEPADAPSALLTTSRVCACCRPGRSDGGKKHLVVLPHDRSSDPTGRCSITPLCMPMARLTTGSVLDTTRVCSEFYSLNPLLPQDQRQSKMLLMSSLDAKLNPVIQALGTKSEQQFSPCCTASHCSRTAVGLAWRGYAAGPVVVDGKRVLS